MRPDPSWLELDRVLSAVLSISHRELSRDQTSVGYSEHSTSQIAERSVFCRLFRTFLVANSREISLLSGVPSILCRELSKVRYFVGCSEHFTVQTAERSDFCRLFWTFHLTKSRESAILSAIRPSWHSEQPTSISITLFWHSKEEPPQKSRRLFFIVDNLVLDKFGLSAFLWKLSNFSSGVDYWNNFLYIAIVSSNVGVNGFPGAQASIMAFLDR